MARVVVMHPDVSEAIALAERVRREGFEAEAYQERGSKGFRRLRENPPAAFLIDLSRMPFFGRWVGCELRGHKSTRMVPLVFLKGEPAKTKQVRQLLPDAVYATILNLGEALSKAIARPPKDPVTPRLGDTAAAPKLKIREDSVVALLRAPKGFADSLGMVPEGVRFQSKIGEADVVLAFMKSAAELSRDLPSLVKELRPRRTVWIVWAKKASNMAGDLTMPRIGEMCGLYGLTGYKSCAVDDTWSAIAIAPRRRR